MTTALRQSTPIPVSQFGSSTEGTSLDPYVPAAIREIAAREGQRAVPRIARDAALSAMVTEACRALPSGHRLYESDARCLSHLADESVHLVLTSPPYWTLKAYSDADGQLGAIDDYEAFLTELDRVWAECMRLLTPGGRTVIVVGDVCLSRRRHGRHVVYPLHASIQEHCRRLGFDNLAPIIWHKIANARLEVDNGSGFLGKPYEPNAVVKNDIEFILFQRKPGGYRQPDMPARLLSIIPQQRHREWYQQIWTLPGASTRHHPAPFPAALAERLICMFSFAGDTVLDPFAGTGTTNVAARVWGRNSIGVEVVGDYLDMARARLQNEQIPIKLLANGR